MLFVACSMHNSGHSVSILSLYLANPFRVQVSVTLFDWKKHAALFGLLVFMIRNWGHAPFLTDCAGLTQVSHHLHTDPLWVPPDRVPGTIPVVVDHDGTFNFFGTMYAPFLSHYDIINCIHRDQYTIHPCWVDITLFAWRMELEDEQWVDYGGGVVHKLLHS